MLCVFSHPACVEAVVCLNPCSKQIRQQIALQSKQMWLSAVHCNARDTAVWPESMHLLIRSARCAFLRHTASAEAVVCLNPCSKQIRQQIALHSRQALLSGVHCNAGDTAVWSEFLLCSVRCVFCACPPKSFVSMHCLLSL